MRKKTLINIALISSLCASICTVGTANADSEKQFSISGISATLNSSTSNTLNFPKQNKKGKGVIVLAQQQTEQSGTSLTNRQAEYENRIKREVNEWVLGLAAGKLEGAPIRLAEELSRVVDDGKNLHVLPVITRGPSSNVHSLLYLRGIDLAVINADILEYYKQQRNIRNISNRINYITQLFLSELHILARPEIRSIEDLKGKVVNFNTKGTSAAFSGPEMFKRLGIKVNEKFIPHPIAMKKMRDSSEIAAVVFVTGKPVRPLVRKKWPKGFHLLSAKYNSKLTDYYLPTVLSSTDYPGLIPQGEQVSTVAVPTLLAAYNWRKNTKRYRKLERFVSYMFRRWDRLQKPPFHKKWRNINLNAKVPGWKRLPSVQEQLDIQQRYKNTSSLRGTGSYAQSDEKLKIAFDKFLRSYAKVNGLTGFTPKQRDQLFLQFYKFWKETNQ